MKVQRIFSKWTPEIRGNPAWRMAAARSLVSSWVILIALVGTNAAHSAVRNPAVLDYVMVVTGGEILDGLYADSHAHFLIQTLRPLGGRCVASITVNDRDEDLAGALRFALENAPVVIVTGGLGPTPNDITREAIATFAGIPLREEEAVVASMEKRFGQTRDKMRDNLRRQSLVPSPGGYLPNSAGTAVGLVFNTTNATIIALPGPPRELQPMVKRELVPLLQARFGLRRPGAALTLRFVGLGQSQISQALQDHAKLPSELVITSQFDAGRVDFTFALPGDTETEREWLSGLARTMRGVLGEYLYAEDTTSLEDQVVGAFSRRGLTLSLIEIGTGGHVTDSLAQVKDLEQVLVGSSIAPTQERLVQFLGLEPAQATENERLAMFARDARARSRSDVAVVICAPERTEEQPRGVRVLWMDASHRETVLPWTDSTTASNAQLTTRVLDWLRRQLANGIP
jgi:nicotinamide-nucleotide amidase